MDPAPQLRDPRERVSPRARLMWMVGGLVRAVFLMAALLVTSLVFDWYELRWWMPVALGVVTLAAALAIPQWRYAVHRWEVTDTAVYTQTGWWRRERRIAPMSRIQTVDFVEGAISRLFRLASVTATTASAAGALEIAGLDRDRARSLVDELHPQGRRDSWRRHVTDELQQQEQPVNPYADRLVDHREWQRLDRLMLLVHPIRELLRFLPVLLGLLIAGSRSGGNDWWLNVLAICAPIALGVARYLTTSFRIAEARVELRRGLLNKHVLSTPIDRVRTVDITASLIHRALGLTTVRVGTGTASKQGEDELALDGVRAHAAEALRSDLLHRTASPEARTSAAAPGNARLVAGFEARWLWYAPFTTAGLIIAAAVLGAGSQVLDSLGLWDHLRLDAAAERAARLSLLVLVPVVVVGLLVVASVLAVAGYLVTYFGFSVTYTRSDHVWHLRRGLFTTRETSMDANRLRGVEVVEPLGLRLARGARLSAIVTGLNREQQGSSTLVPPAPQDVARRVAIDVLGTADPVVTALVGHGSAAIHRRYTRALGWPLVLTAALVVGVLAVDVAPGWLWLALAAVLVSAGLGHDRAKGLGHALLPGHLVARSGSLMRRRVVLETPAIIGWTLTSTWFQRRVGLTTVVATMAGGRQSVTVLDVPEMMGTALARDAVPGLVEQFLVTAGRGGPSRPVTRPGESHGVS